MLITHKIFYIVLLSVTLVACSHIPKEAYFGRGQPESLLDISSEVVNLKIESGSSIQEITNWINKDQPTRAELNCPDGDRLCVKVQKVLHQFDVPVKYTSTPDNTIVLVYERILARDCENRYIDNLVNPYNLHHPTFGCTTAVNIVQMVSDKRQFTSPALMDYSDAGKAVQSVGFYRTPSTFSPAKVDSEFQPLATQTSIQTTGLTGGGSR